MYFDITSAYHSKHAVGCLRVQEMMMIMMMMIIIIIIIIITTTLDFTLEVVAKALSLVSEIA